MMPFSAGASIKNRAFAFENPPHHVGTRDKRELNLAIPQGEIGVKH
jgi:hypothetical protein